MTNSDKVSTELITEVKCFTVEAPRRKKEKQFAAKKKRVKTILNSKWHDTNERKHYENLGSVPFGQLFI